MPSNPSLSIAIILAGLMPPAVLAADEAAAKPKVNFVDNVAPIFQARCNSCHNADKAKGGLTLETFASTMQGGGSGEIVEAGNPDGSHLFGVLNHTEEPKMPPKSPKIPDAELAIIRQWIEAGAPETSGSVVAMKAKPKFEFKLDPSAMGKPSGPPAMPEGVITEPFVVSPKANAIVALASSPWAPLVAVAGHKQVLLYQSNKARLVGVFPFPEGTIHVLKFSRNGALLLAGGGRGGQAGLAVVFDVKTGKRVFEIGKEYDAVLAADISPDHSQVALGGPSKVVRVYGTADGALQFEMKKHTDWITALEFSPDGVLLATGDRNNGLVVWEGQTGREYFDLRGHAGPITDVTWRLDSNVVASASEDGSVRIWEMENGNQIKTWGAHGGGTASAQFAKDGRIVTTGRDRLARVWDQNGAKQQEFEPFGDLALRAVFVEEDAKVVAGDWSGEVRVFDGKDGKRLANLAANPDPIATRLERARAVALAAQAEADNASKELPPLQAVLDEKSALAAKAQQILTAAQQDAQQKLEQVASIEKLEQEKAALLSASEAMLKATRLALEQAQAEKTAAEKAIGETVAAEKSSIEALASTKAAVEKALNEKVAQDQALASAVEALKSASTQDAADQAAATLGEIVARSAHLTTGIALAGKDQVEALRALDRAIAARTAAPGLLVAAIDRARTAEEAIKPIQLEVESIINARAEQAKALADVRGLAQAASAVLETRKAESEASMAAKAVAEKAVADRKPAIDALIARSVEARGEVESLVAEQKLAEAAKTATASNAP
ncbi:c-type cytochrome domain-containing protein [Tundrisphaera lichenicola]|uniref:WD40 domain-containing protein n=1 Tax=Tundrisphaera lichenicola TaxID=2029860 RepID=UPI003EBC8676